MSESAKNAQILNALLQAGILAEKDAQHRIAIILEERLPGRPNPQGSAAIYLRDLKKLAEGGAMPLHTGRLLNTPQVKQWIAELSPVYEALKQRQAGHDAATAVQAPVQTGTTAPQPARFARKISGGPAP